MQSSSSSSKQSSGSNSGGLQSFSNEDLQQMSEMNQGQQSSQSSNGNPRVQSTGDGAQGQQSSQSGSELRNDGRRSDHGGVSQGGGPSSLTYGPETDLIPNSNLRALDGIPQVDWGNSVQFGTAPGQAGEVKTVPVSTMEPFNLSPQ